jgi:hypothetical protein
VALVFSFFISGNWRLEVRMIRSRDLWPLHSPGQLSSSGRERFFDFVRCGVILSEAVFQAKRRISRLTRLAR